MGTNRNACVALFGALCIALAINTAAAQSLYGALVGNVTDATGGVIPGATVVATQAETNLTREVTTSETGAYSIPNIPSGTYTIVVELPGFEKFVVKGVAVQPRRARGRTSEPGDHRRGGQRLGDRGHSPDRERGGHPRHHQRTARDAANERARVSKLHDADARRRTAELLAGRRHQQPRPTMSVTINGQPSANTVVGWMASATINANSSRLGGPQSDRTVNVITSSFDRPGDGGRGGGERR
jgi:hypothetical protein